MIVEITNEQAKEIIKNRMPFGGFWFQEGNKFKGVENTSGDAQVEEFSTKKECISWLKL